MLINELTNIFFIIDLIYLHISAVIYFVLSPLWAFTTYKAICLFPFLHIIIYSQANHLHLMFS